MSNASRNRQVLLVRRPEGIPSPADFEIVDAPAPVLSEGEFRVRNLFLSVDPAQRGWASAEANYSTPIALGTTMRSLALGVVEESRTTDVAVGETLYGWFGWQHQCVATPDRILRRVAPHGLPVSAGASLLGITGLTAMLALTRLGTPRPGETVLVSTAAGSVGSLVGQIARNLGCRVVGLTGSNEKVGRCTADYGYDAAINYQAGGLKEAVAAACPSGVDVFFDNTGGEMLDTALRLMNVRGRVIQCGTAATKSWADQPTGPRVEREILTRRLIWQGFVIFDHVAEFDATASQLAEWARQGKIRYDEEILDGIEQAPASILDLYSGKNSGKRLIRL